MRNRFYGNNFDLPIIKNISCNCYVDFYFLAFEVKIQTLKMTIVRGLRIISSNAQTGTTW
jgi:hypothetical protein